MVAKGPERDGLGPMAEDILHPRPDSFPQLPQDTPLTGVKHPLWRVLLPVLQEPHCLARCAVKLLVLVRAPGG